MKLNFLHSTTSKFGVCIPLMLLSMGVFAQEQLSVIHAMPRSLPDLPEAVGDTLELPFSDDFSDRKDIVSANRWSDFKADVTQTFAILPLSVGQAMLDGVNEYGQPYDINDNTSDSLNDVLTSRYINLGGKTNVFLTFIYQGGGWGDPTEVEDSIVVDFWSPVDSTWDRVWKKGGGLNSVWKYANIPVNQPKYLQKGFRFRIGSLGARNGMFDVWLLDHVYLDAARTANDTVIEDPAFSEVHPSLLKGFRQIPYFHYNPNQLLDTLTFRYRRNGPIPTGGWSLNLGKYSIKQNGSPIKDRLSVPVVTNLLHDQELSFKVPLTPLTLNSMNAESEVVMTTWFDGEAVGIRSNDSLVHVQYFGQCYAFDDGTAEVGYGIENVIGARMAVRYQPLTSDTVKGVDINFVRAGEDASLYTFRLAIWENSVNGPGNLIYLSDSLYRPAYGYGRNEFVHYAFDTSGIYVNGAFYAGTIQNTTTNLNFGFDVNSAGRTRLYYGDQTYWYESLKDGAVMIRPFFKYLPADISVIEVERLTFGVYPNPAGSTLFIDTERMNADVQIVDIQGRVLMKQNWQFGQSLDISQFPNGLYFVQMRAGNSYGVEKLMIQH